MDAETTGNRAKISMVISAGLMGCVTSSSEPPAPAEPIDATNSELIGGGLIGPDTQPGFVYFESGGSRAAAPSSPRARS